MSATARARGMATGSAPACAAAICAAIMGTAMCIPLAGCGPSANTADAVAPPIAAKPDVIITMDNARRTCLVALYTEAQASAVACDDVVAFIRDEMKVAGGSIYDLRTTPGIDKAQTDKVGASLNGAGYRFIGGHALPQ
jgi:hypothetical protein